MDLFILHNHFRPGGVRRVIELGVPWLVQRLRPRVKRVVLLSGDEPANGWWRGFQSQLAPVPAVFRSDPVLNYVSEQSNSEIRTIAARARVFFTTVFAESSDARAIVWAHNQSLGRNLPLTAELERACRARGLPLVFHHHDWWFDNRWQRWPEMLQSGFGALAHVATTIFPSNPGVRHIAINQADATILGRHFPKISGWLPNPAAVSSTGAANVTPRLRAWIRKEVGVEKPIWLMPCRLLRRKNIAEGVLLTRWLRPEAWLVTTAGVSSPDEQIYANRLAAAAKQYGWPLRLGVLARTERNGPTVAQLFSASETVLLTSIQEGFGLPYIEAAMARRPLVSRTLPNIAPDLAAFGLKFPQSYDEAYLDTNLFNWRAERRRQSVLFRAWRQRLPSGLRSWTGVPLVLENETQPAFVPFSRLTLSAQLEALAHPPEVSWAACGSFNPWLRDWREAALSTSLKPTPLPAPALQRLSGWTFARRFSQILRRQGGDRVTRAASVAAQREFIQTKLLGSNLYPLTWSSDT